MPEPARGRADARRNRDAILRAAAGLLAESADVSMSDVARAAGVTRVTVYRHFDHRDDLLEQLVTEQAHDLLPGLLDDVAGLRLDDALDRLAGGVVSVAASQRHLLRAIGPRLQEVTRRAVADEPVVTLLRHWRVTGELTSTLDDDWIARTVRALCLMAVVDESPPEQVADQLARTLRRVVS